jgi:ceramide glucosyltransferase
MDLAYKAFFVLGTLLVAQSFWAFVDGLQFLRSLHRRRRQALQDYTPAAAVIIPCKGLDAGFEAHVSRYLNQEYPEYQVIFVVASETDPAFGFLRQRLQAGAKPVQTSGPEVTLRVAERSDCRGEKVNNLLCGLDAVSPRTEVLAFADSDARPARDWLRSLVAPLADRRVMVSTGFRWYLPGSTFVSQLRAAWDTSIATMMGDHNRNFAWGGSMAIRKADFQRIGVAEKYWRSTVSDDYALTRAVREARGEIRFQPRCLLASHVDSTFGEFLSWANRQIIITRVYAAPLWRLGLAAYVFYCGILILGLAVAVLPGVDAVNRTLAVGLLIVVLLLGAAKGYIRALVARESFPEETAVLGRYGSRYWQLTPLVPWIMLINFVVAAVARKIEWRGTRYHLISRDEVRVVGRENC